MATRDYKNSTAQKRKRKKTAAANPGNWWSFLSGLSLGLLVAFGVYLWAGSLPPPVEVVGRFAQHDNPNSDFTGPITEPIVELPRPKFDFYKILPEMEVPISDWDLAEQEQPGEQTENSLSGGTYVLQVGSFKRFEDADRAKASLALRGIEANIQRVVINGQDVWFRVHVGPLSDVAEIRRMRIKLIESDTDFILLRIGNGTG